MIDDFEIGVAIEILQVLISPIEFAFICSVKQGSCAQLTECHFLLVDHPLGCK